jgi:hypothetical protein
LSGLPLASRLRVSSGVVQLSLESGPENRTLALMTMWARTRRLSSRELFAGRRSRGAGMLRGGSRMMWKGLCSSMG